MQIRIGQLEVAQFSLFERILLQTSTTLAVTMSLFFHVRDWSESSAVFRSLAVWQNDYEKKNCPERSEKEIEPGQKRDFLLFPSFFPFSPPPFPITSRHPQPVHSQQPGPVYSFPLSLSLPTPLSLLLPFFSLGVIILDLAHRHSFLCA
jgi:hypothetical protein